MTKIPISADVTAEYYDKLFSAPGFDEEAWEAEMFGTPEEIAEQGRIFKVLPNETILQAATRNKTERASKTNAVHLPMYVVRKLKSHAKKRGISYAMYVNRILLDIATSQHSAAASR